MKANKRLFIEIPLQMTRQTNKAMSRVAFATRNIEGGIH